MIDNKEKNAKFKPGGAKQTQTGLGFTDFNTGNATTSLTKCLRRAALPTDCTRCVDKCPVRALAIQPSDNLPKAAGKCIRCGLCVELCPTTAIYTTRETPQRLALRLLDTCLKSRSLVVTCERTAALAQMRSKSENPDVGDVEEFKAFDSLRHKNRIHLVPCLGMVASELWFALLNEIGCSQIQQVDVLLPFGQCDACPVNKRGTAESMFEEAICTAERWANHSIGLVTTALDLVEKPVSLLAPLREVTSREASLDRREAFTGAFKSLRDVWNSATEAPPVEVITRMTAAEEALIKRKRREAHMNTILGVRLENAKQSTPPTLLTSPSPQPLVATSPAHIVPKRYVLIESLGCSPVHASTVVLTVSDTDETLCTGCEQCVKACVLQSRSLDKNQKACVDILTCIGCGACIAACPKSVCFLTTITGDSFLLPDLTDSKD